MKKTFEQWLREVDDALQAKVGLTHDDLPDCCYRDWYESGKTPKGAANAALKAADF